MNARDFFSVADYEAIKTARENQEIIKVFDTPFRRTVKVNGNTYTLTVVSGRYVGSDEYHMSVWHDFNHTGIYSRQIYGGTGGGLCCPHTKSFVTTLTESSSTHLIMKKNKQNN